MGVAPLDVTPLVAVVCATVLAGCIAGPALSGDTVEVRVVVGQAFGQAVLLDAVAQVPPDASALAALTEVADVETGYGGGFVTRIEGVESGHPHASVDWFYAVDGIYQPVGARQRTVDDGEVVRWDHHRWDHVMRPGGTLRDPDRVLTGTVPTVVGPEAIADDLDAPHAPAPGPGPVVVAGAWNATVFADLNRAPHSLGLHVHVADNWTVHDPAGRDHRFADPVRAHVALVPSPWGEPTDPAMIVQGRSPADAVDAWRAWDRDRPAGHGFVLAGNTLREVPP